MPAIARRPRRGKAVSVARSADGQRASGREPSDADALSDRDAAILAFERQWWRHAGAKEQAIREEFGLSAARYYQVLGALIDRPAALRHDPMLVKRLLRLREARLAARHARTLPSGDRP
jgi:hypothetical protein